MSSYVIKHFFPEAEYLYLDFLPTLKNIFKNKAMLTPVTI